MNNKRETNRAHSSASGMKGVGGGGGRKKRELDDASKGGWEKNDGQGVSNIRNESFTDLKIPQVYFI